MEFILETINTIIYFECVKSIGELYLNYKSKQLGNEKLFLVIIGIIVAGIMLYSDIGIDSIVHVIGILIVEYLCFQESKKRLVGLYIGTTAVLSMLFMLFNIVSTEVILFFNITNGYDITKVVSSFGVFLCIRLIGKYYKKYENGLKNIDIKYWVLFMIVLFIDSEVMVVIGDFILNTVQVQRRYVAIISYCCVVIGLLIQLVLLINTLVTRNVHKENEKLAKQFLESQNEHYQYLEKREHETKKFRHDIKNHLLLLENLMSIGKFEDAEEYLLTINEKVSLFSNQISVNNGIADAILNRFYTEAQEIGITLKVSGHFPMECYITAYDICTIFSNMLSNAIRAESETEGRDVLVHIKYIENKVLLTVENDYVNELNEVDGIFKTTKEDSIGHGYGLSNVRECVEKNGGYISISTQNYRFKAMVMMINEKEEIL